MSEVPHDHDSNAPNTEGAATPGRVYVLWAVIVALVLLVVIVHLATGGLRSHDLP